MRGIEQSRGRRIGGGTALANGNDNTGDGSSKLSLVTVAAAAASGVGVLGFVTLAGGVVLWSRFAEMGLPADEAVALVPTPTLVATGAAFLLPAVVLTAVPALALMLIKVNTSPVAGIAHAEAVSQAAAAATAAEAATTAAFAAANAAGSAAEAAAAGAAPDAAEAAAAGAAADAAASAQAAQDAAVAAQAAAQTATEIVAPQPGAGAVTRIFRGLLAFFHIKPISEVEAGRAMSRWWAVRIGLVVVVVETALTLWVTHAIGALPSVILVLIALAGGLVVSVSLRFIASGSAVALIAFLAIGTFWVAREYAQTSNVPTVIPLAYSRTQTGFPPRVETGYFVTETSDRIWFASLPHPDAAHPFNELREFPRSETEDLEVGTLVGVGQAVNTAKHFLENLCQRLISLEQAAAAEHKHGKHATSVQIPNGCPAPKRR